MMRMNDEEGVSWKKVTKKTKNFYWGEFKYITDPGFSEEEVYKAWNKKAASRYTYWISGMSKLTTKPLKGVEQKTWDSWTNYWKSEEFQKKSNIGKKNRNRNGKGMVNHIGGSQTFEVHLKRLWMKNIYPDPVEFHRLTHTRKNKPGIFCDDHASQVNIIA